ncbi:MAG: hypothetical protein QM695_02365 [Micropruina sp.]
MEHPGLLSFGSTLVPAVVRDLNWLRERLGDRVIERIVIHAGQFAYRRPDDVAVIPLALLAP